MIAYAVMALTRAVNRETFREAARLWRMPFWAVRISTGSQALSATSAAVLSPVPMASSTPRTVVFNRECRDWFARVRLIAWRAAFLADDVLAIPGSLSGKKRELWIGPHQVSQPSNACAARGSDPGRLVAAPYIGRAPGGQRPLCPGPAKPETAAALGSVSVGFGRRDELIFAQDSGTGRTVA